MEGVVMEYMRQIVRDQYEDFIATKGVSSSFGDYVVCDNPMTNPPSSPSSIPRLELGHRLKTTIGILPNVALAYSGEGNVRARELSLAPVNEAAQASALN
ncbi:uncharacterized protein DS421_13g405590 [Arachis hypogaea]|nr:uncharacterized protein DS421_13g405590 [Arachis hypogaea]